LFLLAQKGATSLLNCVAICPNEVNIYVGQQADSRQAGRQAGRQAKARRLMQGSHQARDAAALIPRPLGVSLLAQKGEGTLNCVAIKTRRVMIAAMIGR
jgi:hypothetical protein